MEALKYIPYVVLLLVVSGIILGAGALSLAQFQDTTTNAQAIQAISNSTSGVIEVAEQMPTVGIISVMVIIITLLVGIFGYLKFFQQ